MDASALLGSDPHDDDNEMSHLLLLEEGNFWAPPDLERIEQHVAFNCTFDTSSINLVRIKLKLQSGMAHHAGAHGGHSGQRQQQLVRILMSAVRQSSLNSKRYE